MADLDTALDGDENVAVTFCHDYIQVQGDRFRMSVYWPARIVLAGATHELAASTFADAAGRLIGRTIQRAGLANDAYVLALSGDAELQIVVEPKPGACESRGRDDRRRAGRPLGAAVMPEPARAVAHRS